MRQRKSGPLSGLRAVILPWQMTASVTSFPCEPKGQREGPKMPFLTGKLSDIRHDHNGMGAHSLRYALYAAVLFQPWAAFHVFRSTRYLRTDMDRGRSQDLLTTASAA